MTFVNRDNYDDARINPYVVSYLRGKGKGTIQRPFPCQIAYSMVQHAPVSP